MGAIDLELENAINNTKKWPDKENAAVAFMVRVANSPLWEEVKTLGGPAMALPLSADVQLLHQWDKRGLFTQAFIPSTQGNRLVAIPKLEALIRKSKEPDTKRDFLGRIQRYESPGQRSL